MQLQSLSVIAWNDYASIAAGNGWRLKHCINRLAMGVVNWLDSPISQLHRDLRRPLAARGSHPCIAIARAHRNDDQDASVIDIDLGANKAASAVGYAFCDEFVVVRVDENLGSARDGLDCGSVTITAVLAGSEAKQSPGQIKTSETNETMAACHPVPQSMSTPSLLLETALRREFHHRRGQGLLP